MIRAIRDGFALRLKLVPPEDGRTRAAQTDCGMGDWVQVFACLISQLFLARAEALALRVGQAFALIAAHRVNQGWSVEGETYALRDVPDDSSHSPLPTENESQ